MGWKIVLILGKQRWSRRSEEVVLREPREKKREALPRGVPGAPGCVQHEVDSKPAPFINHTQRVSAAPNQNTVAHDLWPTCPNPRIGSFGEKQEII